MEKAEIKSQVKEVLSHFGGRREELISILGAVQQKFRYLPRESIEEVSQSLHISQSTIYGVATFYAQFKLTPAGKKIVRICRGTACHVRGSAKVLSELEKTLGVKAGETTGDMEYTLETVACIGACALAPTMTVDEETYGKMTTKKVAEVFGDRNKAGQ